MQALSRILALSLLLATATATVPPASAGLDLGETAGLATSADAALPCPDCRKVYEACIAAGGDVQHCEEVFKACYKACNAAGVVTALDTAEESSAVALPATSCRDQCNKDFRACMDAGIDTDICEELWRRCVAVCDAIDVGAASQSSAVASDEDVAALLDLVHGLDGKGLLPADLLADATATLAPGVSLEELDRVFLRVKALLAGLAGVAPEAVASAAIAPGSIDLAAIPCPDCQQVFHICEEVCVLVLDFCEELFGPHWGPIICRSLTDVRCTDLCEIVAGACWTVCRLLPALPADQAAIAADWSAGLPTLSCRRATAEDLAAVGDEALALALA